ncbi:unnamed protein product, partial [marine sediment metagenome]
SGAGYSWWLFFAAPTEEMILSITADGGGGSLTPSWTTGTDIIGSRVYTDIDVPWDIRPSGDATNYFRLQTVGGVSEITTVGGGDLKLSTSGTALRFDIAGTEQMRLEDGKLVPTTDNDIWLGQATAGFLDQETQDFALPVGFGSTTQRGMTFTTGSGVTTLGIVEYMIKYSTGTGDDIICEIFLADGSHLPIEASLGSKTIGAISNTDFEWITFEFDSLITGLS